MKVTELLAKYINSNSIIGFFALLKILIHLVSPEYGYARDELYYLTISENFSFDNLEILPITPLYLKFITSIFGISIKSLHLASALCGAGVIVFSGLMTKALGGNRNAVFLTVLSVLFSGFLIFGSFMSYDSIDFLIWTVCIYIVILIEKYHNPKLWIIFGILIGIGLLNKLTILLFGAAVFLSLFTGKQIKNYSSIYIWLGGLIAVLSTIPFILWQLKTDWYYLDFAQNYAGGLSYVLSFPEYLWNQFLPNNPFNTIIWITGLAVLLFQRKLKQYRFLGYCFLILFIGCFFLGTKFYFILPFYTVLLAVGSIQTTSFLSKKVVGHNSRKLLNILLVSVYVILSSLLVPFMMPILKEEKLVNYVKILGVDAGIKYEYTELSVLPQHFADRFGWPEMTALVADSYIAVYNEIGEYPGIITANWGQASAISILGKKYDLPEPISRDGWFYLNTMKNHNFKSDYISIGVDSTELSRSFSDIHRMEEFFHQYGIPHENGKIVYYCSNPVIDLKKYWHLMKSPDQEFVRILKQESLEASKEYYFRTLDENIDTLLFTEAQINTMGYDFINDNEIEKAIELFKFNINLFPESFNVYDSYAESLMISGNIDSAIVYYKKSLELNPNNSNAKKMLDRMDLPQ